MSKTQIRWSVVVAVFVLTLIVVPWVRDPERNSLDAPNVVEFPGSYAQLDSGHVRYRLQGPEGAELILLVGGLTTSLEFFDATTTFLNEAGYRTLQFDLYGRGGSARPVHETYGIETYLRQIDELLDDLSINEKVHVVGQSLGGGITISWAVENPERIRSMSIHASAGYLEDMPALSGVISAPLLGDYVWWWVGNNFASGDVPRYFAHPENQTENIAAMEERLRKAATYDGYRQAVLETIRNFGANNMQETFSRVSVVETPLQIIWGKEDAVIPIENSQKLIEWVNGTPEFIALEGVGHMPLLEDPEQVHRLLLDHIIENQGG